MSNCQKLTPQQRRAARRGAETRALYTYEETKFRDRGLTKMRSMKELRRIARLLWDAERTGRPDAAPELVAGQGYYMSERWYSYCEGRRRIVLARSERNVRTLIHEMTHAIGFTTHGVPFRKRYFELLGRYGGRLSADTMAALRVNPRTLRAGGP